MDIRIVHNLGAYVCKPEPEPEPEPEPTYWLIRSQKGSQFLRFPFLEIWAYSNMRNAVYFSLNGRFWVPVFFSLNLVLIPRKYECQKKCLVAPPISLVCSSYSPVSSSYNPICSS